MNTKEDKIDRAQLRAALQRAIGGASSAAQLLEAQRVTTPADDNGLVRHSVSVAIGLLQHVLQWLEAKEKHDDT